MEALGLIALALTTFISVGAVAKFISLGIKMIANEDGKGAYQEKMKNVLKVFALSLLIGSITGIVMHYYK